MSAAAIVLLLALGVAAAATGPRAKATAAVKGQSYAGTTSQDSPVVISVARDGSHVTRLTAFWSASCTLGFNSELTFREVLTGTRTPPAAGAPGHPFFDATLTADGGFNGTSSERLNLGEKHYGELVQVVKGKLGRRSGRGTWHAHVDVFERETGAKISECDTGVMTWRAPRPQRRYYGGVTSRDTPVVVQLSRKRPNVRRRVARFRIGWAARCTLSNGLPDAPAFVGDSVTNFPLARGSFGDTWTASYERTGGGRRDFKYELSGRVGRRTASGTFSVVYAEYNSGGERVLVCRSPQMRWNARQ